jgi:putative cell wall-binding protein
VDTYSVATDVAQGTHYNAASKLTLGQLTITKATPAAADFDYAFANQSLAAGAPNPPVARYVTVKASVSGMTDTDLETYWTADDLSAQSPDSLQQARWTKMSASSYPDAEGIYYVGVRVKDSATNYTGLGDDTVAPATGSKLYLTSYAITDQAAPTAADFKVNTIGQASLVDQDLYHGPVLGVEARVADGVTGMGTITVLYAPSGAPSASATATVPATVGSYDVYVAVAEGSDYLATPDGAPLMMGSYRIIDTTPQTVAPTVATPATPPAVVMGNGKGEGVALRLSVPAIDWGGGTNLGQGWKCDFSGSYSAFDPATPMSLSYNGKHLVYYATNEAGSTQSAPVTIKVSAPATYPISGGKDRIATSQQTALDAWPEGSASAVLAIGSDFKDALAASYLAGWLDAPVLLVSPNVKLNAPIKSTLKTLKVKTVYTVGAAVTDKIRSSVWSGKTTKVSQKGKDGVTEAIDIVKYVTGTLKKPKPTSVLITTTSGFADAMGTAAYAANPKLNMPILYVNGKNDASKASAYVKSLGTVKTTYVLGSTVSVSAAAASKFKGVKRVYGADRNLTAAAAFATFSPMVAKANPDGKLHSVGMAAANGFADALGAGAAQAHLGGVVMLTPPTKVGPQVKIVLRGGTFKSGATTYRPKAVYRDLTNFEFYGLGTSASVRKAISGYVK